MGLPSKSNPISPILLLVFLNLTLLSSSKTDYTTLVFKGCSRQPLSDPTGQYSQSISTLFTTLVQQSSKSLYSKSTSSSSISGLYQCRGDLSNGDCSDCVAKIPSLATQLCPSPSASVRVQLAGCYLLYQTSGFAQISATQMLYKTCNPNVVTGEGFAARRDSALTAMVNGLGRKGFFESNYEGVYVMGQCEGDLSGGDCSDCAKTAVQRAGSECGGALSGQIYLNKCFIRYEYYPNGVPSGGGGGGSSYGGGGGGGSSYSNGRDTTRTVAIIVGSLAGVGFLVICVLFVKGAKKKDDDF